MSIQIQRRKQKRRKRLHQKHKKRRKDVRKFMPMLTVYTGDPSLRMRCNESRDFALTPDPTMHFLSGAAYNFGLTVTYHRLWWYGLKGGVVWNRSGVNPMTHYMTECINHTAYFINSD